MPATSHTTTPPQSLCIGCYYDPADDLGAFLDAVAEIGFAGVEPWFRDRTPYFDELLEETKRRGLAIPSMGGHDSIESGLNDASQHDRIEAELRASIDVAAEHDIGGLICFGGERLVGQSDHEALITCAAGLRRILPYAEERDVPLRIELLNSRVDHFNYVADRTAWGAALCELLGSRHCQLLYDVYHMQIMEGDLCATIRRHGHHFGHVHTAGVPGRGPLDDGQEINYRAVVRTLVEIGYQGIVAHEFFAGGDRLALLRQAFAACSPQGATAGAPA